MNKAIYWLPLFLLTGSAWALEARSPQYVCSRLSSSATRDACYQLVSNSKFFDELAVGACDQLESSKKTLECMKYISDVKFDPIVVKVCDRSENTSDIPGCLLALEYSDFQKDALLACDRIQDAELAFNCLDTISDKTYDRSEVIECDSLLPEEDRVECFEKRGQGDPNAFELIPKESSKKPENTSANKKRTLSFSQFVPKCKPPVQKSNPELENFIKDAGIPVLRAQNPFK